MSLLMLISLAGWMGAADAPGWVVEQDQLLVRGEGGSFGISLRAPELAFEGDTSFSGGMPPVEVSGDIGAGQALSLRYEPLRREDGTMLEVSAFVRWHPEDGVVRKYAELRVVEAKASLLLREVVLETLDGTSLSEEPRIAVPRSMPVFFPGFFAGVEFPVAATRVEAGRVRLAHCPRILLEPGARYQSRTAVYGPARRGEERAAFHRYIEHHRPRPKGLHFNYNSWWTSPAPFTEQDILGLMGVFEAELFTPYGVGLDTFTIDMGWSNPKSLWEIDRGLFPEGFSRIRTAAERMGAHLGLWISPSSFYGPALDPGWALEQGYETFEYSVPWSAAPVRLLSLGGEQYREGFRERLTAMVAKFGIRHIKLDGYYLGNSFEAGPYSAEATAEGGIAAFEAVRIMAPDVWLEGTFDANASPWWLFYLNSVIGGFGDDSPHGRCPCPVYRESYTTARDYYNLQAADRLASPVAAQEILGILHQSDDSFMNDAVMTLLRGNAFVPLYFNPKYMDGKRWGQLAALLQWGRANEDMLVGAALRPIRPEAWERNGIPWGSHDAPMPRSPYGYAHWMDGGGWVVLRNPWIQPQTHALMVDAGVKPSASGNAYAVVSLYPEPRRYGSVRPGETLNVPLAPYETVVLEIGADREFGKIPEVGACVGGLLEVRENACRVTEVTFEAGKAPLGPDWTDRSGNAPGVLELELDGRVGVKASEAWLLVLAEGKNEAPRMEGTVAVNGKAVEIETLGSARGFAASTLPPAEHWTFLKAPLVQGDNTVTVRAQTGLELADLSVWVWATSPAAGQGNYPNSLPAPETLSRDGAVLLPPGAYAGQLTRTTKPRHIEKINGIYLDALEPVSEQQGWGTLQRNQSVWKRPMTIGGKPFLRGLGGHAPSEVVYRLDGSLRVFEAIVGPDGANNGTVTFEVYVDNVKQWESGLMTPKDAPVGIQVPISGASTLRLVVGDGGDGIIGDHADWAEAKLLH